jgi:hypothetical protein
MGLCGWAGTRGTLCRCDSRSAAQVWVRNMNPANATLVDNKSVDDKVQLTHGQIITISERRFRYESLVTSEDDVTVCLAAQAKVRAWV